MVRRVWPIPISENRTLFDISDRQLVHISKVVDELVERVDDLESRLKEATDELAEIDRKNRLGWSS